MNIKRDKTIVLSEEALLELKIYAFLRRAGVPLDTQGGKLLLSALKLCLGEAEYMEGVTKRLYPKLAEMFNTSAPCVEKNMREAISKAWENGLREFFETYLIRGRKKPGNSIFIKQMVFILKIS